MKVIINVMTERRVEIPNDFFKTYDEDGITRYELTREGYKKYIGKKSHLLEGSETSVAQMFTLDEDLIAYDD